MKAKNKTSIFFCTLLVLPVTAYSQATTTRPSKSEPASVTQSTHPGDTQPVKAILFEKGKTKLTAESEKEIKTFIENAKAQGKIKEVKVASWSDQETPSQPEKDLPKEDRKLAEERAESIKKYLHSGLNIKDVKIYNMAHGTSKLAKLFNTEESELRIAFSQKGNDEKLRSEVRLIRDHGKPSSAVLVVEYQKGRTS